MCRLHRDIFFLSISFIFFFLKWETQFHNKSLSVSGNCREKTQSPPIQHSYTCYLHDYWSQNRKWYHLFVTHSRHLERTINFTHVLWSIFDFVLAGLNLIYLILPSVKQIYCELVLIVLGVSYWRLLSCVLEALVSHGMI